MLSQWRGHADNARGCSVGFSLSKLEDYCARSNRIVTINEVDYIKRDNLKQIIWDNAKEVLPQIVSLRDDAKNLINSQNLTDEELDILMKVLSTGLFKKLLFDSLRYKWADFREEKEWRMFFNSITKDEKTLFANEKDLPDWQLKYDKDYLAQHNKMAFLPKKTVLFHIFL